VTFLLSQRSPYRSMFFVISAFSWTCILHLCWVLSKQQKIPLYFKACVFNYLLSHPTGRWSFGIYRWLYAQLLMGTTATKYEDKAGNGWSHVRISSQVSYWPPNRWDKGESNNGGCYSLDCWTLWVLLLRDVKHLLCLLILILWRCMEVLDFSK